MSTRQYIGARYVPKFFDWDGSAEWRSGVAYEALTIVTRNGNSYTSKIPVPSNIGAPESNPHYWVATGLYNEQLETYRAEVQEVADRVEEVANDTAQAIADEETARTDADTALGVRIDAEATARTDADTGLGDRIDAEASTRADADTALGDRIDAEATARANADNAILTEVNLLVHRKYVFIGDSYLQATAEGGGNYATVACKTLGATIGTDAWTYANGGSGFINHGTGGLTFFDLLNTAHTELLSVSSEITDVVVCSGGNDKESSASDIVTAITQFVTQVKTYFPNCYVHLSCIAGNQNAQDLNSIMGHIKQAIDSITLPKVNIIYNGYVPMLNNGYYNVDAVHPSPEGAAQIGRIIGSAVLGRSCYGVCMRAGWTTNLNYNSNVASHSGGINLRITPLGYYIEAKEFNVQYTDAINLTYNSGGVLPIGSYTRGAYGLVGLSNHTGMSLVVTEIPLTFLSLVGGSTWNMELGHLVTSYDSSTGNIKIDVVVQNASPGTFDARGVWIRGFKQFISF